MFDDDVWAAQLKIEHGVGFDKIFEVYELRWVFDLFPKTA
jgi:hypothetical protein